jgi:hypothetical protein
LLCKAHNLLHARNCFGALHLAAKLAATRCRGPAHNRANSGGSPGETRLRFRALQIAHDQSATDAGG